MNGHQLVVCMQWIVFSGFRNFVAPNTKKHFQETILWVEISFSEICTLLVEWQEIIYIFIAEDHLVHLVLIYYTQFLKQRKSYFILQNHQNVLFLIRFELHSLNGEIKRSLALHPALSYLVLNMYLSCFQWNDLQNKLALN